MSEKKFQSCSACFLIDAFSRLFLLFSEYYDQSAEYQLRGVSITVDLAEVLST